MSEEGYNNDLEFILITKEAQKNRTNIVNIFIENDKTIFTSDKEHYVGEIVKYKENTYKIISKKYRRSDNNKHVVEHKMTLL